MAANGAGNRLEVYFPTRAQRLEHRSPCALTMKNAMIVLKLACPKILTMMFKVMQSSGRLKSKVPKPEMKNCESVCLDSTQQQLTRKSPETIRV
ncbi:hypothetical protein EVAR_93545_1 [Eumeta japonica]|uniref:Uncharacterized protein n=1 Tax=Eumeta variegata TaxID=151549 RepID=A0A4C1UR23_EUMVA|nr:hypothetical protein EVAR_93545_1 [Eumeta japonica]